MAEPVTPMIAILDDDGDLVASIAEILRRYGFSAVTFTDPVRFSLAAKSAPSDAYIVDWLLGDVTAVSVIAGLRAIEGSGDVPIFLLSGNLAVGGRPSDPELDQAISRYELQYRVKPYSTLKLAKDVHDALYGG